MNITIPKPSIKINYKRMAIGSAKTAVVVGTLLVLLNRYEEIFSLQFSLKDLPKWSLNYVMPFLVSFYSRYMVLRNSTKPC
jgi:hypothetical protein